jgi:hypothetical protein
MASELIPDVAGIRNSLRLYEFGGCKADEKPGFLNHK